MADDESNRSLFTKAIIRLFNIENPSYLILLLGVLVVFGLGYGLFKSDSQFLYALRSAEVSRGLITFLVAVTTVSLAILVVLYAISSTLPEDQIKERLGFSKEILTTMVGILGTVLGFYFGSSDKLGTQALQLADVQFRAGQILTHVSGGSVPYRYTISYPGQDAKTKAMLISKDGWIIEQLNPIPTKPETFAFEIIDSKEQRLNKTAPFVPEESSEQKPPAPKQPVLEKTPPQPGNTTPNTTSTASPPTK